MRAKIAAMRWDMSMQRLLTLLARFNSRATTRAPAGRLPALLVLSDDARGYSLGDQRARWPSGVAFIERTFGRDVHPHVNTDRSRLRLATCTPRAARKNRLDGLHWPQKHIGQRRVSATRGLIETTSAHSGLAIAKAARLNFDAILVSTAFQSDSPSATRPLGAIRLARLQRAFPRAKLYALGGITLATTRQLRRTRISGVALVSFDGD